MKNIAENNVIRFTNISQKKEGMFANFKVKALHNGVTISASISVDITALDLEATDPLEKIIEDSVRFGMRQLGSIKFTFEGIESLSANLGVAQLG